jgi:thiamine biosynthesis lipoprotein ApbE
MSLAGCSPEEELALPEKDKVEAFRTLAEHFGDITLAEEDGKYYVTKPLDAVVEVEGVNYSLAIDLGGIGKGYAADVVKEMTKEAGFDYGYFSFGGSSMSLLSYYYAADNNFKLALIDPRNPSAQGGYMSVGASDEGLSTSGDYVQYYTDSQTGVNYCHIINPKTGRPIRVEYDDETGADIYTEGITSVTVIGGSAAEDDALTTALSAMGKERAISYINQYLTDRRVTFTFETSSKGKEVYTNIPAGQFTLNNSQYTVMGYGDGEGHIVDTAVEVEIPQTVTTEKPEGYGQLTQEGFILNTSYVIALVGKKDDEEELARARTLVKNIGSFLDQIDESLSVGAEKTSYIYRFNRAAAGETVEVDKLTYDMLTLALKLYEQTEGYYNPGVYYSVDLYGFAPYSMLSAAEGK